MKTLGIVLVIVGSLFFIFDSIDFERDKKVIDLGDIEVTSKDTETVELNKVVGGLVIFAGLGLVLFTTTPRKLKSN
jgi:hypothetical protein